MGRLTYTRFMARPCYVYLKLKMPRPSGVIHVTGNQKLAEECFQKGSQIAGEQMAMAELDEYKKAMDLSDLLKCKKHRAICFPVDRRDEASAH